LILRNKSNDFDKLSSIFVKDIKDIKMLSSEAIEYLFSDKTINLCIIGNYNTFFRHIYGKEKLYQLFSQRSKNIENGYLVDGSRKDEFRKRNDIIIRDLKSKQCNTTLIKQIMLNSAFAGYFVSKLASLVHIDTITWLSDRDPMIDYGDHILYDLFLENIHSMHFSERLPREIRYVNEYCDEKEKNEVLIRMPDYLAGSFSDYDYINQYCTSEKHEYLIDKALNSTNTMVIQVDQGNNLDILRVGKIRYLEN
jgi:hypothetical protein